MNDNKRQHPIYAFFTFIEYLRYMIIPIFVILIANPKAREILPVYWLILLIFLVLIGVFLACVFEWYRFTYRVEGGRLKVEQGVLIRKRRDISRERIYSIDESAGIFHRLFRVVKVTIETAGGKGKPEVVLHALKPQEADAMRKALSKKHVEQEENEKDAVQTEEFSHQHVLSGKQLFIAGATSGKIGVVMAIVGGLFSQVDDFIPDEFFEDMFRQIVESSIVFLGALLVVAAVVAWLLAILGTVLKYAGFTLSVTNNELRMEYGLLERRQLTIPVKRIQAVRIEEGILRQPFGLAAIYLETGGGGGEDDDFSTVLFPLLARKEVKPFLDKTLPDYIGNSVWERLPKRAARRYLFRAVMPVVAIALIVSFFTAWGYLLFLLVPFVSGYAYLAYRDAGWAIDGQRLMLRFRKFSRTTVVVKRRRVQASEIQQSFFQKRAKLASFKISVISSFAGAHFKVRDLDEQDGRDLLSWYIQ